MCAKHENVPGKRSADAESPGTPWGWFTQTRESRNRAGGALRARASTGIAPVRHNAHAKGINTPKESDAHPRNAKKHAGKALRRRGNSKNAPEKHHTDARSQEMMKRGSLNCIFCDFYAADVIAAKKHYTPVGGGTNLSLLEVTSSLCMSKNVEERRQSVRSSGK